MRQQFWIGIGMAALFVLGGCGFHLRGGTPIPESMKTLRIEGSSAYSPLLRQLQPRLQSADVKLVHAKKAPAAVLRVYRDDLRKNVLSVGAKARVREFELLYDVEFSVFGRHGKALVKDQKISLRREYSFDESQLLGKAREEEFLREEMYKEMADLLMGRLGSVPQ